MRREQDLGCKLARRRARRAQQAGDLRAAWRRCRVEQAGDGSGADGVVCHGGLLARTWDRRKPDQAGPRAEIRVGSPMRGSAAAPRRVGIGVQAQRGPRGRDLADAQLQRAPPDRRPTHRGPRPGGGRCARAARPQAPRIRSGGSRRRIPRFQRTQRIALVAASSAAASTITFSQPAQQRGGERIQGARRCAASSRGRRAAPSAARSAARWRTPARRGACARRRSARAPAPSACSSSERHRVLARADRPTVSSSSGRGRRSCRSRAVRRSRQRRRVVAQRCHLGAIRGAVTAKKGSRPIPRGRRRARHRRWRSARRARAQAVAPQIHEDEGGVAHGVAMAQRRVELDRVEGQRLAVETTMLPRCRVAMAFAHAALGAAQGENVARCRSNSRSLSVIADPSPLPAERREIGTRPGEHAHRIAVKPARPATPRGNRRRAAPARPHRPRPERRARRVDRAAVRCRSGRMRSSQSIAPVASSWFTDARLRERARTGRTSR